MIDPQPLFVYFRSFQIQIFQKNFRTRIVGVEGEHTDHLTTTTIKAITHRVANYGDFTTSGLSRQSF